MSIPIKSWPRKSATQPTDDLAAKAFTLASGEKARRPTSCGTATSSTITNGMLAVDFYDATSPQLI